MALYRPLNGAGRSYVKASGTVTVSKQTTASSVERILLGFNCDSYVLNNSIQVQDGDVIGACIYDPGLHSDSLILVSESTNNGYMMMSATAGCGSGTLPDVVNDPIVDSVLKVLHISAEISKKNRIVPTPPFKELPTMKLAVLAILSCT